MAYLASYFVLGILVCTGVALVGRARGKKDFTPLLFVLGSEPVSFLVGFLFWPVWIAVQVKWQVRLGLSVAAFITGRPNGIETQG